MNMKKNYQIAKSRADLQTVLSYVRTGDYIAFDIETDSVEEIDANVYGIGVSCKFDEGWYIPLREWGTLKNTVTGEVQDCAIPVLGGSDEEDFVKSLCDTLMSKKLIMHNGVYDVTVMYHRYGIDLGPALYCDTILLKHTLDEERPFGLKDLANKYHYDIGFTDDEIANQEQLDLKKSVIQKGGKWTMKQKDMFMADTDILGKYCCADVDLTLKLFDYLEIEYLEPEKLDNFFYNQEVMPLYRKATIPMKMRGVYVDVDYFKGLKSEIEDGIIKLTDEVFDLIGDQIEPKVKEILDDTVKTTKTGTFAAKALQYYNIDPPINGKTGKPTLAKSALRSLEQTYPNHPVLEWLLYEQPTKEVQETKEIENDYGEIEEVTVTKKIPDPEFPGPSLPEDVIYAIKKEIYVEKKPDLPNVFNLSSTKHLAWLLFECYDCEPTSFSRKTGAPQVDKDSLEKYDLPFIPKLAKLKKEEKLLSTYVIPIIEKQRSGWLYPSMLQFGTTSGRYSCAGGLNLQTLPRDDVRIKRGFIAPPGYKVVNADFSSLEPRIFSWVSNDPGLKRVWTENLDLYSDIAINVFGLEGYSADPKSPDYLKKKAPEWRQKAKVFTLAVPYGANEWRIAGIMKIDVREAKSIIETYLTKYPLLAEYMHDQEEQAAIYGKVSTQFGRVRHLPQAAELYEEYGEMLFNKLSMAVEFGGPRAQRLYNLYNKARRSKSRKEEAKELRQEIMSAGSQGVEVYYKFRNLLNNAKNFPIQATAAHVANASLIKLSDAFKEHNVDGWIALQIHDEITCIVKEDQAEFVSGLLKDAMENNPVTEQIDIPMIAEPLIADNFAEAK